MTPGLDGPQMGETVHEFYTLEGAVALRQALSQWQGGRLVVHIVELPIKCPVAPLEFAFLADDHFRKQGMRERVEITYVTPLSGAFTKPIASRNGRRTRTPHSLERRDSDRGDRARRGEPREDCRRASRG